MKKLTLLLGLMILLFTPAATFVGPGSMFIGVGRVNAPGGSVVSGPSPIAQWKFNDGSGTSATDSSGNGNTGTLVNTTWGTGPNSNGDTVYDGTGDTVTMANESNFDFERSVPFSITFWIKVNASATSSRLLLSKNSSAGNLEGYLVTSDTDNSQLKFGMIDSAGTFIHADSGAGSVTAGTWFFVACTYDGSSTGAGLKIYINAGAPVAASGTVANTILNNDALIVGVKAGLGSDLWAELDDLRVYNIELTSGQISTINADLAQ